MRFILALTGFIPTLVFAQNVRFTKEMLDDPITNKDQLERSVGRIEVGKFEKNGFIKSILLENDYVSARIKNPKAWPTDGNNKIIQVNLIFTKYPVDINEWKTNYYQLMADRYKELFKIDPRFNSTSIKYYIVLQTNCSSENEASKLFHGFEIIYSSPVMVNPNKRKPVVLQYITKTGGIKNTEVYDILGTTNTDSTLIVLDCTGSMESYKNQVLMYLADNTEKRDLYFSLFNDDRSNGDTIGNSGGVKTSIFREPEELIAAFDTLNKTLIKNPDQAENDIEAVLKGIKKFPFVKKVILFRDQESCVWDINLAKCIKIPVYVIADDIDTKITNSHSLHIAAVTGGAFYIGNGTWISSKEILTGQFFNMYRHTYYFSSTSNHGEYKGLLFYSQRDCQEYYKTECECKPSD